MRGRTAGRLLLQCPRRNCVIFEAWRTDTCGRQLLRRGVTWVKGGRGGGGQWHNAVQSRWAQRQHWQRPQNGRNTGGKGLFPRRDPTHLLPLPKLKRMPKMQASWSTRLRVGVRSAGAGGPLEMEHRPHPNDFSPTAAAPHTTTLAVRFAAINNAPGVAVAGCRRGAS